MQKPFIISGVEKLAINHQNLFTWVYPKNFPLKLIIYTVTATPRYGTLFKKNNPRKRITMKGNFTQQVHNFQVRMKAENCFTITAFYFLNYVILYCDIGTR